jgi:cytoskeletal protein CcmA (bactofilin family)
MTRLDLDLMPEPAPASPTVLAARQRRALVVGLGGGRDSDSPLAKSSFAERRLRSSDTASTRFVDPLSGVAVVQAAAGAPERRPPPAPAGQLRLDDALMVPAGVLIRGYVRCRALLLVGDVVGNIHCTAGPVVIRSGASLKGRLVAFGDVYVCGTVGDSGGGAVITTRGKLTLAPGARVDGDVRSGWLVVHDGAMLHGTARRCED